MSQPYIGEVRIVAFTFAPQGWAFCDGSTQSISQNEALYTLLGTTYGGDGQQTFNLPNLLGRVPIHMGGGYVQGALAGTEQVGVIAQQLPVHNHLLAATTAGASSTSPGGNLLATSGVDAYVPPTNVQPMSSNSTATGGYTKHENMMPFLCINYIISLYGVYPSQN